MSRKLYDQVGPVAFTTIANTAVLAPTTTASAIKDYLHIHSVEVGNSSGANASVGWGIRLPNAMWKAGKWTNIGTVYTDDTTDAQDSDADDFPLSTLSVNNDGYVVQSLDKFNIVNLVISTAQNGAGTAEYNYWNGSAWTTLPTIATPTVTSTGTVSLVFLSPVDWTPLVAADAPVATSGLTAGYYAIRVRYTTAPVTTAGLLTSLNIIQLKDYVELVGDGASAVKEWHDLKLPYRASLVPYCSTANAANWCLVEYRNGG